VEATRLLLIANATIIAWRQGKDKQAGDAWRPHAVGQSASRRSLPAVAEVSRGDEFWWNNAEE
jgi:hypothetical protein